MQWQCAFTSTRLDTSWTALHKDDDAWECRFFTWVIQHDQWSWLFLFGIMVCGRNVESVCSCTLSLTLIRAVFSIDAGPPRSRKSSSSPSFPFGLFRFHSGPESSGFCSDFLFLECCLRRPDSLVSSWQEASTYGEKKKSDIFSKIFIWGKWLGSKETKGSLAERKSALKSLWRSHSKCFKGGIKGEGRLREACLMLH